MRWVGCDLRIKNEKIEPFAVRLSARSQIARPANDFVDVWTGLLWPQLTWRSELRPERAFPLTLSEVLNTRRWVLELVASGSSSLCGTTNRDAPPPGLLPSVPSQRHRSRPVPDWVA